MSEGDAPSDELERIGFSSIETPTVKVYLERPTGSFWRSTSLIVSKLEKLPAAERANVKRVVNDAPQLELVNEGRTFNVRAEKGDKAKLVDNRRKRDAEKRHRSASLNRSAFFRVSIRRPSSKLCGGANSAPQRGPLLLDGNRVEAGDRTTVDMLLQAHVIRLGE